MLVTAPPLHAGRPPSPWLKKREAGPAGGVKGGAERNGVECNEAQWSGAECTLPLTPPGKARLG
jgi:hypothetical protein